MKMRKYFSISGTLQYFIRLKKSVLESRAFLANLPKIKYSKEQSYYSIYKRWRKIRRYGYTFAYARSMGIFRPDYDMRKLNVHVVSRRDFSRLQLGVNPRQMKPMTEDKMIFYKLCRAYDIPIPDIYGYFFRDHGLYTEDGILLTKREAIESFIADLPEDIIIKPALGLYGRSINAFFRKNGSFTDAKGNISSPGDIVKKALLDKDYDSFVIQKKLYGHGELGEISGTETLQCTRVISLVEDNGEVKIILTLVRMIVGDNITDNFNYGASGNITAFFDPGTGRFIHAYKFREGGGRTPITSHPVTGNQIIGKQVPEWEEAKAVVKKAALKFLPLRTIGWDVAITNDGIFILEGNMFWDPPNESGLLPTVMETLLNSSTKFNYSK